MTRSAEMDEKRKSSIPKKAYEQELLRLQEELVKMEDWARGNDRMRRWKLSETDLYSRTRWVDYSRAKDEMFVHTDIAEAPWHVVDADDKRRARLNCIAHLLSMIPYQEKPLPGITIPERQDDEGYVRPPLETYTYVPDHAASLAE
jgi:polyphosphate kinase 2 (PPK2 family)